MIKRAGFDFRCRLPSDAVPARDRRVGGTRRPIPRAGRSRADAFDARKAGMAAHRARPRLHPQPDAAGHRAGQDGRLDRAARARHQRPARRLRIRTSGLTAKPLGGARWRGACWRASRESLDGRHRNDAGRRGAGQGLRDAARPVPGARHRALHLRHAVALVRAAARRGSGALHRRERIRALLVDHPVCRHRRLRERQPPALVLIGPRRHHAVRCRRKTATGAALRRGADQLHLDGPAAPRRAAPRGLADLLHPVAGRAGAADPLAGRQDPRRAADRRDLRLRRQGGDRADQPDAGDPVRLPVRAAADCCRGSPTCCSRARPTRRRSWPSARRRCTRSSACSCRCGTTRSRQPDRARPDLAAGQQSGHRRRQRSAELLQQHHPADRRRQRHHPPLDHRRPASR